MRKALITTALLITIPCGAIARSVPTVPLIERFERPGNILVVEDRGRNGKIKLKSTADIKYVDHRPQIQKNEESATAWWGSAGGEWRRQGWESPNGEPGIIGIVQDVVEPGSQHGVLSGTREQKIIKEESNE